MAQPLRIVELEAGVVARDRVGLAREPLLPEVEGRVPGDPPLNGVHHPGPGPAAPDPWVLEERDVAPWRAFLVRVEQVVDGRVVLVDRLLDEPEPEDAGVEIRVSVSVARDARDVVYAVEPHPGPAYPPLVRLPDVKIGIVV